MQLSLKDIFIFAFYPQLSWTLFRALLKSLLKINDNGGNWEILSALTEKTLVAINTFIYIHSLNRYEITPERSLWVFKKKRRKTIYIYIRYK